MTGREGLMRWTAVMIAFRAARFWDRVRSLSSMPWLAATAKEAVAMARVLGREAITEAVLAS